MARRLDQIGARTLEAERENRRQWPRFRPPNGDGVFGQGGVIGQADIGGAVRMFLRAERPIDASLPGEDGEGEECDRGGEENAHGRGRGADVWQSKANWLYDSECFALTTAATPSHTGFGEWCSVELQSKLSKRTVGDDYALYG